MQWVPEIPVVYDKFGRMNYNPMFHENMNKPWPLADRKYLIEWYDLIGPEEMSFAVGRTIGSVMQRVTDLRKEGVMVKPLKKWNTKRIK